MMLIEGAPRIVLAKLHIAMRDKSKRVKPTRWQGIDVSHNPAAEMHELRWTHLHMFLGTEGLSYYQQSLSPDLPWADEHFLERVSGIPHNPQPSEARWPYGDGSNLAFRNEGEQHSHTYSERYWPKFAGNGPNEFGLYDTRGAISHAGIRYPYGDLSDLVKLLVVEPDTRQAVLPLFFPEDTGTAHRGRKPCSLHYHFYLDGDTLDIEYSIRSCDYHRHFKNDVYLTIRLLIWVLERCRRMDSSWDKVRPGKLIMGIGSLHLFRNDYIGLFP